MPLLYLSVFTREYSHLAGLVHSTALGTALVLNHLMRVLVVQLENRTLNHIAEAIS